MVSGLLAATDGFDGTVTHATRFATQVGEQYL
jgi:hypothetical protein